MKDKLRDLISKGKTDEAIQRLLNLTRQLKNKDLTEETLLQSARYEQYKKEKRQGTSSSENQQISISRINQALLEIISTLPDESTSDHSMTPEQVDREVKKSGNLWKWIVSLSVLLGILASVAGFTGVSLIDLFDSDSTASHSITVLVHSKKGKHDLVLPNRGVVYLIYGDAKIPEQINNEGEATFKQIPRSFFRKNAKVEIQFQDPEGEPYRASHPDSLYNIKRGEYLSLEVELEEMDRISGLVKDFKTGAFIEGVTIRVEGIDTVTNKFGEFVLDFPQEKQRKFVTIRAFKEGYLNYELSQVPTTTEKDIIIPLEPKE